ncbi:unnamed protein product, partial [marine sediment metagenome]
MSKATQSDEGLHQAWRTVGATLRGTRRPIHSKLFI